MALKPCKECKKEVSTSAKTCPHCGVSNPAHSAGSMLGGLALLVAIIGGCAALLGGESADKPSPPPEQKISDEECKKTLQCWGDRHLVGASIRCASHIEKLGKFDHKWTDGVLEPKMSRFRWLDQGAGALTYIGDKIQFQNGFGAWQNHIYECDYDAGTGKPIEVRAQPGRL